MRKVEGLVEVLLGRRATVEVCRVGKPDKDEMDGTRGVKMMSFGNKQEVGVINVRGRATSSAHKWPWPEPQFRPTGLHAQAG